MWGIHNAFVRDGCELFQEVNRSRLSKITQQPCGEVAVQPSTPLRYHLKLWFLDFVVKLYFVQEL